MAATTRPTLRAQSRSPAAVRCIHDLRTLRHFYRSTARLAQALGWRPSTVDDWLEGRVARPRMGHRDQVRRLLRLSVEAAEWTVERQQVGDWTLEPHTALAGRAPSEILRVLGDDGLDQLLRNFVRIAPRTRVGSAELPSADQLRVALAQTLDGDTRAVVERAARAPRVDLDLSDFD